MADYKEMCLTLFREVARAITILQEAQIHAEEIFLLSDEAEIRMLSSSSGATTAGNKDGR